MDARLTLKSLSAFGSLQTLHVLSSAIGTPILYQPVASGGGPMATEIDQIADVIVATIQAALVPLHDRIGVLEARLSEGVLDRCEVLEQELTRLKAVEPLPAITGPAGPAGRDGKDADFLAVKALAESLVTSGLSGLPSLVQTEVSKAVAAIPVPKDGAAGRDGANGASVDPAIVDVMVSAQVERAVKALPVPRDGIDGRDGAKGLDGAMGPQGERGEAGSVGPMGPQGERGETGPSGTKGLDGEIGARGPEGLPGRDGRDGHTGEKGADGQHGKNGIDGAPGRDGTLEHLKIVRVDDRTFRFCQKDGTPVEGGEQHFPLMLFRGTFEDAKAYEPGDVVVSRGSSWVALEPTQRRPGDGIGKAWALVAQRGRDGTKGDSGAPGHQGPPGKDLTQLGSDGSKW